VQTMKSHYNWLFFVFLLLSQFLFTSCALKPESSLPRLTAEEEGLRYPGRFVWFELVTSDREQSEAFYTELFGWHFAKAEKSADYFVITNEAREIGGMILVDGKDDGVESSRWLSSLSVKNVDEASSLAKTLGGEVLYGPEESGERGRIALIKDSEGAELVLLFSKNGDPASYGKRSGNPVWIDLFSKSKETSGAFYRDLIGYQLAEAIKDTSHYYFLIDEKVKGGMVVSPMEDIESNWLPFVGVVDLPQSVSRAIHLGATLLAYAESAAVIQDPGGAAIGLQMLVNGDN
jgi:predicted enzyme related to lactoylglutathione lyase